MMPRALPCVQRALKAQKYKAWGNAPGTQPPNYCRAVGAKVAVGVTSGNSAKAPIVHASITSGMVVIPLILCFATFIENRLRLGHPSKLVVLSLHCFCANSAHYPRRNDTWGVAPGFILLHKTGYALAIRASSWRSACTVFALSARAVCGGAVTGAVIFIP